MNRLNENGANSSDLQAHGVPDHQRRMITACRCVVAASADPEIPLTAEGIAEGTGLSQAIVLEILSSDEFRELLQQSIQARCATALSKGIRVVEEIMLTSKSESLRLKAFSDLVKTYKALAEIEPTRERSVSDEEIQQFLAQLRPARSSDGSTEHP